MPTAPRLPKLPQLLDRKIYKTGQTRGADDDVIYQNRVSRTSTVLIPYSLWQQCKVPSPGQNYENGFIVLISPTDYFGKPGRDLELRSEGLALGRNALVFYETRTQWEDNNPETLNWSAATNRINELGGQYVARIPATTAANNGAKINRGFTETSMKGAGIRVYEYASSATIELCRLQLEALFWLCSDSISVMVSNGMTLENAQLRRKGNLERCEAHDLLDTARLKHARMLNDSGNSVCPLCLEELSAQGFLNRLEQAAGREVPDLTVTQLNLFHIEELKHGVLNHRPYNLGWGHHHCNVVVKDSGILETLEWMKLVIHRNLAEGYLS